MCQLQYQQADTREDVRLHLTATDISEEAPRSPGAYQDEKKEDYCVSVALGLLKYRGRVCRISPSTRPALSGKKSRVCCS